MSNANIDIDVHDRPELKKNFVAVEVIDHSDKIVIGTDNYINTYQIKLRPARKGSKKMIPYLEEVGYEKAWR